jgi:hypothetical protein
MRNTLCFGDGRGILSRPLAAFSVAVFSVVAGCTSSRDAACEPKGDADSASAKSRTRPITFSGDPTLVVVRATYRQTKGPCFRDGDAWVMPLVDAFDIAEVLEGKFHAKHITVRLFGEHAPHYPRELVEGNEYVLCLRLSDETKADLREKEEKGYDFLWMDRCEIELQKADADDNQGQEEPVPLPRRNHEDP